MSSASDLLLHLRPCATIVRFQGSEYTIPAMDAVEWVILLDGPSPDLYDLFPTRAGVEAIDHVENAIDEGLVTMDEVAKVGYEAITVAADRPWWVVLRIIYAAKSAWDVVHVNAAQGMSLAGWLDEVWSKIMAHIDPKKKAGWLTDMERVPKGWGKEVDFDAEEQAFLAAMNQVMR